MAFGELLCIFNSCLQMIGFMGTNDFQLASIRENGCVWLERKVTVVEKVLINIIASKVSESSV